MTNNDILRKIRYAFDFSDSKMIEIFALADYKVTKADVSGWLKREDDEGYKSLHDLKFAIFLNGLITDRRGKKDGPQPKPEKTLTNNIIFRKLKIALNLTDTDIIEIYNLVDMNVSKHELSALFRKPTQSQYRLCKDQFLRNFLYGMQLKYRKKGK
ncbi:DUF1456 family protein [Limibacter armeniacum]|uniref:DUF1456 family protein n=1 Tax=Limibacter armeniacum TaxID=466084 RepID=UPI002FE637CC